MLRQFPVDGAVQRAFTSNLTAFLEKEQERQDVLAQTSSPFEIQEDPSPYRSWLDSSESIFEDFTALKQHGFVSWFDLFRSDQATPAVGDSIIASLARIGREVVAAEGEATTPFSSIGLRRSMQVSWRIGCGS